MSAWLIFTGLGVALALYLRRPKRVAVRLRPTLPQTGKCFRAVVGESHYQRALAAAANGQAVKLLPVMVELVLEDDNEFDADAVAVYLHGEKVGYLSAGDAVEYRYALARAQLPFVAQVVAGAITGGGAKHYGIWIDLPNNLRTR